MTIFTSVIKTKNNVTISTASKSGSAAFQYWKNNYHRAESYNAKQNTALLSYATKFACISDQQYFHAGGMAAQGAFFKAAVAAGMRKAVTSSLLGSQVDAKVVTVYDHRLRSRRHDENARLRGVADVSIESKAVINKVSAEDFLIIYYYYQPTGESSHTVLLPPSISFD